MKLNDLLPVYVLWCITLVMWIIFSLVSLSEFALESKHGRDYHRLAKKRAGPMELNPNKIWNMTTFRNSYYVLSNAQCVADLEGIIASDPDHNDSDIRYQLTPLGRQQAQQAGQDIIREIIRYQYKGVYVNSAKEFPHAEETARIVYDEIMNWTRHDFYKFPMGGSNFGFSYDSNLEERWFGIYDGTSDENYEIIWRHDAMSSSTAIDKSVETVDSVTYRITKVVLDDENHYSDMPYEYKNKKRMIIYVGHGDVLRILQTAFLKRPGSSHRSIPHLEPATLRPLYLASSPVSSLQSS